MRNDRTFSWSNFTTNDGSIQASHSAWNGGLSRDLSTPGFEEIGWKKNNGDTANGKEYQQFVHRSICLISCEFGSSRHGQRRSADRADFEKVGNSVIGRIGDPSVRKRTGISLTADEPQIRKVIS
jgi:hypothetical protein